MTPLNALPTVAPNDDLLSAAQLMSANDLLFLPVFEGGRLAGLLTRDEVMRYLAQHPSAA
jgi:CBS domain-containing protein